MKIIVSNREEIEQGLVVDAAYLLISIRDPDRRSVRFKKPSGLVAALELAFHDAEPAAGFSVPPQIKMMTHDQAHQICEFIKARPDKAEAIVVHCEQGMSRSPAVALAIAEHLALDTDWIWESFQPNQFVYGLVADAFNESDGMLND